jgi:GH25 family lysozyme M1 (1,4-beta-N-acetylmuramidase)
MKKLIAYAAILMAASFAVSPLMAQRPMGINVSSLQGAINWSSVASSGVKYAFARATVGITSQDAYFAANMVNGKTAGVLMGPVHYSRPDLDTPAQEASYFWSHANPYIKADTKTVMPTIDFEVLAGHVGATSYTDWLNNWSANVIADGHTAHVTLRPLVYLSLNSACSLTTNLTLAAFMANENPSSTSAGSPWSCCTSCNLWDVGGTGGWTFWDFGNGVIPGISGNVSFDTYNGTLTGLKATEIVTPF